VERVETNPVAGLEVKRVDYISLTRWIRRVDYFIPVKVHGFMGTPIWQI
jgi:hypothetical protein